VAYGNDATQRNDASTLSLGVTPAHPAGLSSQWQAGGQTYDLSDLISNGLGDLAGPGCDLAGPSNKREEFFYIYIYFVMIFEK
jgi:hypothetical protein